MKKNLRIVSAAAAALLAVAPVAATAMPVNAAANQTITLPGAPASTAGDISLASNLKAVTYPEQTITNNNTGVSHDHMWNGKISGSVVATFNGKQYTVNLPATLNSSNMGLYEKDGKDLKPVKANSEGKYRLVPADTYYVYVQGASINLGTENANLSGKTLGSNGDVFYAPVDGSYTTTTETEAKAGDTINIGSKSLKAAKSMDQATAKKYAKDAVGTKVKGTKVKNPIPANTDVKVLKANDNDSNAVVQYTEKAGNKTYTKVAYVSRKALVTTTVNKHHNGYIKELNSANATLPVGTNVNGGVYVEGANHENLGNTFSMLVKVVATDVTNSESVNFFEKATNTKVTTGSLNMTANPSTHELNVQDVLNAAIAKYSARQDGDKTNSGATITTTVKDLTDQLTRAGIKVDPLGNFQAPASFSFNLSAESAANKAVATLPVTVSVANAAQTPAAQETTRTVKVMHISTIYDKNGKATHEPALRAYHTVSVVSDPVTLKDETGKDAGKFYKLAGKDQYIKVGNVDGTSRSLKHNSYVYKSTGKRANKKTLKKGSSVTTYGKSFMIAGHQMYRIGKNQYVKKANF